MIPRYRALVTRAASWLAVAVVAGAAVVCLRWWLAYDPAKDFVEFIPGMDGSLGAPKPVAETVRIGEFGETFNTAQAQTALAGSWPRFRGPDSSNVSRDMTRLAEQWGEGGPKALWSVELGEGHAAPAVMNGRVYVLDYDETRRADALRCFSLADGREIWRRWYRVNVKRNHGMSRTIPTVTDKYVVTIGPRCHVMCVDAVSGALLWGMDLEKDFGAAVPLWYTGQCPLVDDDVAVFAACGKKALLLGVDCRTGALLWQAPNPEGWEMSHSSVMPMTLGGRKMYVYAAVGGVAGVSAENGERGKVLWKTAEWNPSVVVPSPVVFPDGRIFLTAGYGAGSTMLKVSEENGAYRMTSLYTIRPQEGLASEQQTPILYEGFLFGILPNDAGELRNQFVCFDPAGKILWASGKNHLFGLGPYMEADGKFFILSDEGVLTAARAGTEKFEPLARAKVLQGRDSWGPIALAKGRMLLRDSRRMVCIDVAAR
jgi:outer membrane protein assembly factor BamB